MSHTAKVTPLALLTRQPWQAIKAPIALRSCVSRETAGPICSRAAHLALSTRWPRRPLQSSGTLWPHFSCFSLQTWVSRETHRAWASSEPHWARGTFHGQLSLLQYRLSLGLLEGHWGSFEGAARELERHHDDSARWAPDPINARNSREASRAR